MSDTLLVAIKNQLKDAKYKIVSDTLERLKSLDLEKDQVDYYLNWAYSNALSDTGELDEKQYFQNLNQLPLIEDIDAPQKFVKTLSIDDALNVLSELLIQQTSSLQEIRVEYWYGTLTMDDGYVTQVRILNKVRPIELAEVIATRENFDNFQDVEIVLKSDDTNVFLNDIQKMESLEEIVENEDTLLFFFKQAKDKISLEFTSQSTQIFHAIETVTDY